MIRRARAAGLIRAAIMITAAAVVILFFPRPSASSPASGSPSAPAAIQFGTLPPGAKLPSGAQCARWVKAAPSPENRPGNAVPDHTTGESVGRDFFPAGDSPQVARLVPLISGGFTGTTEEILRWAACKWGISQDIVFAQAAVESWWRQDTLGDWGTDAALCPPGHGPGADGRGGQCPQSYGILQTRYPFEQASWPGMASSTAMNADTAYAIWRSCYDGYEVWLNDVPRGRRYQAGDLWGCVGRWYAGSWYTPAAEQYISTVKEYLHERVWQQPDFGQAG